MTHTARLSIERRGRIGRYHEDSPRTHFRRQRVSHASRFIRKGYGKVKEVNKKIVDEAREVVRKKDEAGKS